MGLESLDEIKQLGVDDLSLDEDRDDDFNPHSFARSPGPFVNVDYQSYRRRGGVLTEQGLKRITSQIPTHSQLKAARASLQNGEIPPLDLQWNRIYANLFSFLPDEVPQSVLISEVQIIAPRQPKESYKSTHPPVQELMGLY